MHRGGCRPPLLSINIERETFLIPSSIQRDTEAQNRIEKRTGACASEREGERARVLVNKCQNSE